MDLQATWFVLLTLLLGGYAVLDGFDLGVGILHPLARTEEERRTLLAAIGPIWDGNEVWLVTFGGALFAAFPVAYATVLSGFYTAFMLLLFALVLRAVSIEFRGKVHALGWRRLWDGAFFLSSFLASFLYGVAVGNALVGIPLDEGFVFRGSFTDLLRPYPLLVGGAVVVTFAMHGAIFLHLKTRGALRDRLREWMWRTWGLFLLCYLLGTIWTLVAIPRAAENVRALPLSAGVVVVSVLAIANIPRAIYRERFFQAFVSSGVALFSLVVLAAFVLWPNLVTNALDPARSLTLDRAASGERSLRVMLVIAAVGMPFVLAYTVVVYWTFRGAAEAPREGGY